MDGLLGRRHEQAEFDAVFRRLTQGLGGIVLVCGEPGMGKSRVVEHAAATAAGRGIRVLTGRARPTEGAPPLWPWWEAVQGLPAGSTLLPDHLALPAAAAAGERLRAFDAFLRRLSEYAGRAGLLVVLEDLHWADESSWRLLGQAIGRPGVVVVATCRDTELAGVSREVLAELTREASTRVLALRPWTLGEVADFVGSDAHPGWAPILTRHSGGNPLIVGELLAALAQSGVATAAPPPDQRWPLGIPARLTDMVADRLARVSPAARLAVQACSVVATRCTPHDLGSLCGLPDPTAATTEAVLAGLLTADPGTGRIHGGHALIEAVVYDGIEPSRRAGWHRQLAADIDAGRRVGDLVSHRLRSAVDDIGRLAAVQACRVHAEAAARRLAFDRAEDLLDSAVAVAASLRTPSGRLRAELLLAAAEVNFADGRTDLAVTRCQRAADACGDADVLVRAALVVHGVGGGHNAAIVDMCQRALAAAPDDAGRARVLAQHALAAAAMGVAAEAGPASLEALRLAEITGDPLALSDALRARQLAVSGPAGVTERLELARRMLALVTDTAGPADAPLWGRIWRVDAAFQLGTPRILDEELHHLGMLAERLGWPLARWHLHRLTAARELLHGRFDSALAESTRACELAVRNGDLVGTALHTSFRTEVARLCGPSPEAVDDALAFFAAVPLPIVWSSVGRFLHAAGRLDEARRCFDRLRPTVRDLPEDGLWLPVLAQTGELAVLFDDEDTTDHCYRAILPYADYFLASGNGTVVCDGAVSRPLGIMAAGLRRPDDAARHFDDAIALEDRIGALPYRTLSQLGGATVAAAQQQWTRAAQFAHQATATARRLGMAPALAQAVDLSAKVRRDQHRAVSLTTREQEILAMVSLGDSNRAIAGELVLSERTVETHVSNVLAKLGVANRGQAIAWAVRHGYDDRHAR